MLASYGPGGSELMSGKIGLRTTIIAAPQQANFLSGLHTKQARRQIGGEIQSLCQPHSRREQQKRSI
jgi:hypothetical protein